MAVPAAKVEWAGVRGAMNEIIRFGQVCVFASGQSGGSSPIRSDVGRDENKNGAFPGDSGKPQGFSANKHLFDPNQSPGDPPLLRHWANRQLASLPGTEGASQRSNRNGVEVEYRQTRVEPRFLGAEGSLGQSTVPLFGNVTRSFSTYAFPGLGAKPHAGAFFSRSNRAGRWWRASCRQCCRRSAKTHSARRRWSNG